jgi:hypothetical protein
VYECLLEEGGGFIITFFFFAAWLATSFSDTCVWPGTQQICIEPPSMYINLSHASQVKTRALKDLKTLCDELVNNNRSWITIFRLSKQI